MLVDFYLIDNDLWWSACCNETGRYQALDMRAYIPNRGPWKARRVPQEWGPARYAAQVLTDLGNDRIRNLYIAAHGNNGELDLGGQESLRTDNVETCLKPLADVIDRPAQGWPNVEFMDCWVVSETEGHPKAAMGEADTDLCKSDKDQSPECSAMLLRVQKKLQGRFTGDPQGVGLRFMLKVANCLPADPASTFVAASSVPLAAGGGSVACTGGNGRPMGSASREARLGHAGPPAMIATPSGSFF